MSTLNILLSNNIFALFAIISLGMLLGKVKIANITMGNSTVIFVALIFGHFHYTIPDGIGRLGIVLFIY